MASVIATALCIRCRQPFGFNPHSVPSIVVNGVREPLCSQCVPILSAIRVDKGLPPIVPQPDAYEAIPAEAL